VTTRKMAGRPTKLALDPADIVHIVADGSIAGLVADGRMVPLVIIDTTERARPRRTRTPASKRSESSRRLSSSSEGDPTPAPPDGNDQNIDCGRFGSRSFAPASCI
jgi:hypothetical protein